MPRPNIGTIIHVNVGKIDHRSQHTKLQHGLEGTIATRGIATSDSDFYHPWPRTRLATQMTTAWHLRPAPPRPQNAKPPTNIRCLSACHLTSTAPCPPPTRSFRQTPDPGLTPAQPTFSPARTRLPAHMPSSSRWRQSTCQARSIHTALKVTRDQALKVSAHPPRALTPPGNPGTAQRHKYSPRPAFQTLAFTSPCGP